MIGDQLMGIFNSKHACHQHD